MNAVLLRYYPHNSNKVFQQSFQNIKLKAGSYVYSQNDRIKKLCSTLDKTLNNIKAIDSEKIDNLQIYQIILINPTQMQVMQMKQTLLKLGAEKMQQRIQMYSDYIQQMNATLDRLNKKKNKYIKNSGKENV